MRSKVTLVVDILCSDEGHDKVMNVGAGGRRGFGHVWDRHWPAEARRHVETPQKSGNIERREGPLENRDRHTRASGSMNLCSRLKRT